MAGHPLDSRRDPSNDRPLPATIRTESKVNDRDPPIGGGNSCHLGKEVAPLRERNLVEHQCGGDQVKVTIREWEPAAVREPELNSGPEAISRPLQHCRRHIDAGYVAASFAIWHEPGPGSAPDVEYPPSRLRVDGLGGCSAQPSVQRLKNSIVDSSSAAVRIVPTGHAETVPNSWDQRPSGRLESAMPVTIPDTTTGRSIRSMQLIPEPLGRQNLEEVFQYFRAANPFAQHTWGWDTGRFVDWPWGSSPEFEEANPGWMGRNCTVFRDGTEIAAVSVSEYGDATECIITARERPDVVGVVLPYLLVQHRERDIALAFEFSDRAQWLRSIFLEAGLTEETGTGHEWEYDLEHAAGPAPLPDGFLLGSLADLAPPPLPAVAECIRRAFDSQHDLEASLRRLQSNPMYRPELSVFAQGPDGTIAAYCRGTVDSENGVCGIDPVCTHPDYQRLGLGKAVVQSCLATQRSLGGRFAYIGSAAEPAPGTFLYRSLGPVGRMDGCRWSIG